VGPADLLTNYSELKVETFMRDTLHPPDRRKLSWPYATANGERKSPARSPRLARPTIGFWLGGGLLGTAGCILGLCMPYHHPVAVVLSALWWGIYLGCFGGSVGALIALVTDRAPAPASQGIRWLKLIGSAGNDTCRSEALLILTRSVSEVGSR
jgi:hypothetical protein